MSQQRHARARPPRLPRDELIATITSFYTFLTSMYLPSSALKLPPPEGGHSITPETTRGLNKSALVVDLMRHLPYIDDSRKGEMKTMIHYKSDVVDYSVDTERKFQGEQLGEISLVQRLEEGGSNNENDDEGDAETMNIPITKTSTTRSGGADTWIPKRSFSKTCSSSQRATRAEAATSCLTRTKDLSTKR
jgi:hypothetical protein